ncbi:FtsJ-like methyltransferase-domain-containing protein [Halteromyces radiatus]|uniref:FtsJ-like methyltransferase-domain-containing protein n=1 Tax=Halteromyces radiatus TaxID=101107 RepID=UPI00221FDEB2|nr:FtsJ-like methyltransferase-domain-containing protein [Halteromyces radiatus]KAI8085975.1 FtsJ-like methyltransferase-domain-containing protein [Halteromyces radiatus]
MSQELYTDTDPDYRNTPIYSGIPPPSIRDIQWSTRQYDYPNQQHQGDLSRYNPQRQLDISTRTDSPRYQYSQQQQGTLSKEHESIYQHPASSQLQPAIVEAPAQPPLPIAQPLPKLDMRTSTDFIECGNEQGSIQLNLQDLCLCIQVAPAKIDYDFLCSKDLVKTALELKDKGRQVPDHVRQSAKKRSNPFDCIGKHIFMNRDATKLAALDATFHLTPSNESTGKTFMFADLCGGPGGFSEYLFWRVHQSDGGSARGYGMTLRSSLTENHWHLENISPNITVNFTQVDGIDGTGNLYQKANILEFDAVVSNNTKKRGVDLVVADGEENNDGKDGKLESLNKQLILCQVITMLTCLKQGGTFVCKMFDMFEEFTADVVWLLYQLFEGVCITKPLTSEPSSSERFLICKKLRYQHPTKLIDALLAVNDELNNKEGQVDSFVPRQILEKDQVFIDYVKMRNMKFLLKQIDALEQMETFIADQNKTNVYSPDRVKRQSLQEWRLPLDGE